MSLTINVSDIGIALEIIGFVYILAHQINVKKFLFKKIQVNESQYDAITKIKFFQRGVILVVIGLLLQWSYFQVIVDQFLNY